MTTLDGQLMNNDRCVYNLSGSEKIEFTFECFKYKLFGDIKFSLLAIVFFIIISVDICLNSIVLFSILFEKSRKRVDICFMSNAVADLIMGLIIMPFTAVYTLFGHFPFGEYVCFFWNCIDFTTGTVSMLHIAFISYDRYLSVSKPIKYTQKTTDKFSVTGIPTYLVLIFIWFFAAGAWVPAILYLKSKNQDFDYSIFPFETNTTVSKINKNLDNHQANLLYDCDLEASPVIVVPHSLIVYFLPMLLIFLFYSKTILIVNEKMKRRRSSLITPRYVSSSISYNYSSHQAGRQSIVGEYHDGDINSEDKKHCCKGFCSVFSRCFKKNSLENVPFDLTRYNTNLNEDLIEEEKPEELVNNEDLTKAECRPYGGILKKITKFKLSNEKLDDENVIEDFNEIISLKPDWTKRYSLELSRDRNVINENFTKDCSHKSDYKIFRSMNDLSQDGNSLLNSKNLNAIFNGDKDKKYLCNSNSSNNHMLLNKREELTRRASCFISRFKISKNFKRRHFSCTETKNMYEAITDVTRNNLQPVMVNNGILKKPLEDRANNGEFIIKKSSVRSNNKNLSFKLAQAQSPSFDSPKFLLSKYDSNNKKFANEIESDNQKSKSKNMIKRLSIASSLPSNVNSSPISKRERNVTYKLSFIMITFVFSWLPFCVLWPLTSICSTCISQDLYIFSFWLAYLNSIFTPFILLYNNSKYRSSIIVLKRVFCKLNCFLRHETSSKLFNNYASDGGGGCGGKFGMRKQSLNSNYQRSIIIDGPSRFKNIGAL